MLAALLIVFREALEAGLIVGIVLAATEGLGGRVRLVVGGAAVGLLGAGLLAVFAGAIAQAFAGAGQDLVNAAILIVAVLMLAWHILWMAGHARAMSRDLRDLGREVSAGDRSLMALGVVVAAAILREGSEVVLFLYGLVASGGDRPVMMLGGGLAGLALAVVVSWLLYRGLLKIPVGKLFAVTNGLLSVLAAGMAGQAAVYLANAGLLPPLGEQVWDTSAILPDDTLIGRALHALVGYSDRPMGVQVIVYLTVLCGLVGLQRLGAGKDQELRAAKQRP